MGRGVVMISRLGIHFHPHHAACDAVHMLVKAARSLGRKEAPQEECLVARLAGLDHPFGTPRARVAPCLEVTVMECSVCRQAMFVLSCVVGATWQVVASL